MNLTNNLVNKKLVVALSGGVDSVALLHYYKQHKNVRAIHVNHNLSQNSLKWQQFCKKLCFKFNIKLDIFQLKINKLNNLEQRARDGRYKILFTNLKKDEILLTAHHKNDQVETLLLNLFRGSSTLGLSAMLKIRNKHYRPFLSISKDEIINYAKENNLNFITDESNFNNNLRRNFVRNEVLPLIKSNYPQIVNLLNEVVKKQQNNLNLIDDLAKIDIKKYNLVKDKLLNINKLKQLEEHRILNIIYFHLRSLNFKLPNTKIAKQIFNALFSANDSLILIKWGEYECRKFNGFLYFLLVEKK